MHSSLQTAYDRVQSAIAELDWPHPELRAASCWMDLMLEEVRDTDRAALDADRIALVHDTFLRVHALAEVLRDHEATIELRTAVDALLDAFAPMFDA